MVAAAVVKRHRAIIPGVWLVAVALSVAAALGWPAGPLVVGGVSGEPFEIGPLLQGWSLRQTVTPERGPELFVGFQARPTASTESPPTLEARLERDDTVLWADRLRLTRQGMTEYVATFPVATDPGSYTLAVRVLDAPEGGVVLRGVDIGDPDAKTQLSIMEQPLRGFLALGHRTFQRLPLVLHLEAVAAALEDWTIAVAAGVAVLAGLVGAAAAVLMARVYGRVMALVMALAGVAALVVWLFVAAAHLSVPLNAGAHIGILQGLTPTGIAALLAFPLVVIAGFAVIVVRAPRAAVESVGSVARGLGLATIAAIRHWYLAPIPLGGGAAAAWMQEAEDLATVLAFLTGAWALLGVAATAAVARRGRPEEATPEAPGCDVSVERGARRVTR